MLIFLLIIFILGVWMLV